MRMTPVLLAVTYVASAAAAPASAADPERSDSAAPAAPADGKRICVQETATGSVMPRRTCLTAAQWKLRNAQERRDRPPASTVIGQDMVRIPDPK